MAKPKDYPPTTGKTLREIVGERQVLDEWLLEQEGELTPELDSLMRDQEADEKTKIEAVGYYIATEEEEIETIKRQVARLEARRRAKENRIDWLKNRYLAEMLMKLGFKTGDAVKGALATVRIQLNNPRLDGEVPEALLTDWMIDEQRAKFVRYIPEQYELDKVAFLTAAKLDESLLPEGVKIVRDESVRVA
jgi:hypothetical protein